MDAAGQDHDQRRRYGRAGPVAYLCRSECLFKPPSVQKRPGFSSPMLSAVDADCRSH